MWIEGGSSLCVCYVPASIIESNEVNTFTYFVSMLCAGNTSRGRYGPCDSQLSNCNQRLYQQFTRNVSSNVNIIIIVDIYYILNSEEEETTIRNYMKPQFLAFSEGLKE